VGFYIYNILRDSRKANDLLQAKNYYFLSLLLQIQRKKLSSSFSDFTKILAEEGRESFDLKLYPVVESRSIKNIAVDDLLKYYSEPVKHQNDVGFEQIQKAWFYCFEYCQQWESSQEDANQKQKYIVSRGKVFYDEFFEKYEKIETKVKTFTSGIFAETLFDSFNKLLKKQQNLIESNQQLPSMYSIVEDFYKPISLIFSKEDFWSDDTIMKMIRNSQQIYIMYWSFISEKVAQFSREIENQHKHEIEFDKSIKILINYSIQHSDEEFKDMYRTLGNHVNGKQ
jgi:hypothetical protein